MIKRNIAIAALVLVIIAVFSVAIIKILTAGAGNTPVKKNYSSQPSMKISDVIEEAVYMGSYSSDTEIYADEQFSAKEVLKSAIRKSESLPETVEVLIEGHNYDDLSVMFDDGNTMKLLEQSGNTTVMIVASVPKLSGDVFYAYNVQIVVNESRGPAGTDAPAVTGVTVSRVTRLPVTRAFWNWDNDTDETTAASKVTWAKVTTAAAGSASKPVTKPGVTAVVTEAEPSSHPVTEAPAPSEPPSVEPSVPDPVQPSEVPPVQDPSPEPEPEPPADPPAEPEPPADPPAAEDTPAE